MLTARGRGNGVTVPGAPATGLTLEPPHVHDLVSLSSDSTLNPNGVRFGSSEIYNIGERSPLSRHYSQVIQERRKGCLSGDLLSEDATFWHNSCPFASGRENRRV